MRQLIVIAALAIFAGTAAADDTVATGITRVELEVKAPLSTARLTLNPSGRIDYSAESPSTGIHGVEASKQVTPDEFASLAELISNGGFSLLEPEYADGNLADATRQTVTVWTSGWKKTVSCYGPCPAILETVIAKIKELWGREILQVGM